MVLAASGHILAGGHTDPVLMLLLTAGTALAAYGWLGRERGLPAIAAAVVIVQAGCHLVLLTGHNGAYGMPMLATHAGAALLLAVFLRCGEARIYAAARRRYLHWLIAVRVALAGLRPTPVRTVVIAAEPAVLESLWFSGGVNGRGPPRPAFL